MYPEHCATIRTTRLHDGVWPRPIAAAIANAAGQVIIHHFSSNTNQVEGGSFERCRRQRQRPHPELDRFSNERSSSTRSVLNYGFGRCDGPDVAGACESREIVGAYAPWGGRNLVVPHGTTGCGWDCPGAVEVVESRAMRRRRFIAAMRWCSHQCSWGSAVAQFAVTAHDPGDLVRPSAGVVGKPFGFRCFGLRRAANSTVSCRAG